MRNERVLRNHHTRLLYNPHDPDDFKATVLRFKDETLRERLSASAYKEVSEMGWEGPAEQVLDYLDVTLDIPRHSILTQASVYVT